MTFSNASRLDAELARKEMRTIDVPAMLRNVVSIFRDIIGDDSRALMLANGEVKEGERRANKLIAGMQNTLLDVGQLGRIPVSIDYIAAVDPITLKHVDAITGPTVLAIAARVGKTRLIDNIVVTP